MKITTLGLITAIKNVGAFLATYVIADIKADPQQFIFSLIVFLLITTPGDIYLLNKAHEHNGDGE